MDAYRSPFSLLVLEDLESAKRDALVKAHGFSAYNFNE